MTFPQYVAGSITEVWPGCFVGSGMVRDPAAWKRDHKVDAVFIASHSTYRDYGWVYLNDAIPLCFDDNFDGLTVGQLATLLRFLALYPPEAGRYAFLCQAGLNRSSVMACLWRWWHTKQPMSRIVGDLKRARHQFSVLYNEQFCDDLLSLDRPLSSQIGVSA